MIPTLDLHTKNIFLKFKGPVTVCRNKNSIIIILSHWKFVGKALWTQSNLKSTTSRCEKVYSWQVTITEPEPMLFFRKMITVLNSEVWDVEGVWKLLIIQVKNPSAAIYWFWWYSNSKWYQAHSSNTFCIIMNSQIWRCSMCWNPLQLPLFDTQSVHILASGSQFKLSPECFQHSPRSLW